MAAPDPIRARRVTNIREAQSLMNAESVYMASQLQMEIARCRIWPLQSCCVSSSPAQARKHNMQ